MYIRICVDCGDRKEVVRLQKGTPRCVPCSLEARTKNKGGHTRICTDCGESKWFKHKPTADKCLPCTMKERKKNHTRICIDCGDEQEVACVANTINKRCRPCELIERKRVKGWVDKPKVVKVKKPKVEKVKKVTKPRKKSKYVSKEAIERVRAINKEHRAANKAKKEVKPMNDPNKERMMIESFYKTNKVVHVDCTELYGQTTLRMNCHD